MKGKQRLAKWHLTDLLHKLNELEPLECPGNTGSSLAVHFSGKEGDLVRMRREYDNQVKPICNSRLYHYLSGLTKISNPRTQIDILFKIMFSVLLLYEFSRVKS